MFRHYDDNDDTRRVVYPIARTQSFDISPSRMDLDISPMHHDAAKYFKVIPDFDDDESSSDGEAPASPPSNATSCVHVIAAPEAHRAQAIDAYSAAPLSIQFSGRRPSEHIRTIDKISGGSNVSAFVKPTPHKFVPLQLPRAHGRLYHEKSRNALNYEGSIRASKSRKISPLYHSRHARYESTTHHVAAGSAKPEARHFMPMIARTSNEASSTSLSPSSAFTPIHPSSVFAPVKSRYPPISINGKPSAYSPPKKKITCENDHYCIHPTPSRSSKYNASANDCCVHTSITPDMIDDLRISSKDTYFLYGNDNMADCIENC